MNGSDSPQISIIVPIHPGLQRANNLKEWISNFPDSGIAEVIAVFDGENDQVHEFMLERILSGKPIKILNVDCGNPGGARNKGLEEARGKWVTFWDSDDIGNLEPLFAEIDRSEDGIELIIGRAELYIAGEAKLVLESNPKDVVFNPGIWRFLFKRESLSGIQFPELSSGEDQVFLARHQFLDRNMTQSEQIFYRYFIGSESQLTRNREKLFDAKIAASLVMEASFLSDKWKSGYSTMSARLLSSYLRRGPGSIINRARNVLLVILSFRNPSFILRLIKTWIYSVPKGIR